MRITTGKHAGLGTVEANVYQRNVDYPDEFANGQHFILEIEEVVTVRWDLAAAKDELRSIDGKNAPLPRPMAKTACSPPGRLGGGASWKWPSPHTRRNRVYPPGGGAAQK